MHLNEDAATLQQFQGHPEAALDFVKLVETAAAVSCVPDCGPDARLQRLNSHLKDFFLSNLLPGLRALVVFRLFFSASSSMLPRLD